MGIFSTVTLMLVAAGTPASVPSQHAKNPNDLICRDLPLSGSRLDEKRVCMTRLQWEDQRRETRQTIEKAQTQQINAGR